jgi:mannose-6-phosphate isomerase-like protein (cupin superfamily)/putative sterol carrier protein
LNDIRKLLAVFISIFCIGNVIFSQEKVSTEALLKAFIDDFKKNDIFPENPLEFGIKIHGPKGGEWKIKIDENKKISLEKGLPEKPTFNVISDLKTLVKVRRGEINALTAAGKARSSDKTPMDLEFQEGYTPSVEYIRGVVLPFYFHFFTSGAPEIIPFGEKFSRTVHGANTVPLYYDLGLRTAWYQIKKGMFINKDLKDAANPFNSLFIFTKGKGKGRIGDKILDLKEGRAIFVPAGVIHQFWTENEDILEMILIMFGEGA